MAQVSGTYQGVPILDCEYVMQVGVEPGRGWVRVLLKDIGGTLSLSSKLSQLKEFLNRDKKKEVKANRMFGNRGDADTVGSTTSSPAPAGFKSLDGPYGDLVLETGADEGNEATKVTFKNVFWVEAVIEDINSDETGKSEVIPGVVRFGRTGVVRIELVDERILWSMGGYVMGWRNRVINDVKESIAGKIFQWDPSLKNPTSLNDISDSVANADKQRPILDELTLFRRNSVWTVFTLLDDAMQELPGPPEMGILAENILNVPDLNVNYGAATLAKSVLEDLSNRFNLAVSPNYAGGFFIYDVGQEATRGVGGKFRRLDEVPKKFWHEHNSLDNTVVNDLAPVSIEIIGERIIQEIYCPDWVMVMRDDGSVFQDGGGLGRQGRWVPVRDWLAAKGVSFEAAADSLIANYEKSDSSAYIQLFGDKNDPLAKNAAEVLKRHFFKSFMVAPGPFRRFLPMLEDRAEGSSPALNLTNMAIQRPATFFADGWTPSQVRETGNPFFINASLQRVEPEALAKIDKEQGVITFKEPRGVIIFAPDFAFVDNADSAGDARDIHADYINKVEQLRAQIQKFFDNIAFGSEGKTVHRDLHFEAKQALEAFSSSPSLGGHTWGGKFVEVIMDKRTIATVTGIAEKLGQEAMPSQEGSVMNSEGANLSECQIVEPRISGIWGWESSYGRSDDWYRRRFGEFPEYSPFPVKIPGLRQYITIDGKTNKAAIDVLAEIEAKVYVGKSKTAIKASVLRFMGFHEILPSGTIPQVSFRMSVLDPPEAETVAHERRTQHGTEGRPPAVASWTAFKKPIGRGGGGLSGAGKHPFGTVGAGEEAKRNGRQ